MDIMEFLKTRRTYRRFEQKPVEPAIAREIMEAARIASCGANRQTLKYVLVQSPEMVAKMQPLVHWAAYLPPEQGQPKPDETPVLFVAVCQDESLPGLERHLVALEGFGAHFRALGIQHDGDRDILFRTQTLDAVNARALLFVRAV